MRASTIASRPSSKPEVVLRFALSELELKRAEDSDLLPRLSRLLAERSWVLVTADDAMPADHGDLLAELRVTLATIDPNRRPPIPASAWPREIVHRWGARHG